MRGGFASAAAKSGAVVMRTAEFDSHSIFGKACRLAGAAQGAP